jgi:hypothetical protein
MSPPRFINTTSSNITAVAATSSPPGIVERRKEGRNDGPQKASERRKQDPRGRGGMRAVKRREGQGAERE